MSSVPGRSKCTKRSHTEAGTSAALISTKMFVPFIAETKINHDLLLYINLKPDALFPSVFMYLFIHQLQTLPISLCSSAVTVGRDTKVNVNFINTYFGVYIKMLLSKDHVELSALYQNE
jgi:hypothetical protein